MTTKVAGRQRRTGFIAITCEAQEALAVGDPVHLIGDYEVELADGTKPIIGFASVANKGRVSTLLGSSVGQPIVPGDVTIEVRGFDTRTVTAGAAVAAGAKVGFNGTRFVTYTGVPGTVGNSATVSFVGIALTAAAANGNKFDLLTQ